MRLAAADPPRHHLPLALLPALLLHVPGRPSRPLGPGAAPPAPGGALLRGEAGHPHPGDPPQRAAEVDATLPGPSRKT